MPKLSFTLALILFLTGFIGIGLTVTATVPDIWILPSFGIGLGAWLIIAVWGFIEKTFAMIHHIKQSRIIQQDLKTEIELENAQPIRSGISSAKRRAFKRRLSLWMDTMWGEPD